VTEANPYVGAYPFLRARRAVWREIVRYVSRDAPDVGTLVELGAGYCDFVNEFPAKRKIAFDLNPEMRAFADPEVELRIEEAQHLVTLPAGSVDLVFASNFLEHLPQGEVDELLRSAHRVLRSGGRLMLIQPNHRLCADHYFDDPTHVTIFDDLNLPALLAHHGFDVVRCVPGLLPFSMQSRAPKWPLLVRLYLNAPFRPLGAQMYVVAERP
jgi:SAM-dependent methyltransferase